MREVRYDLNSDEQEHVTLYYYNRPNKFKIKTIELQQYTSESESFLIDTLDDYLKLAAKISSNDRMVPTLKLLQKWSKTRDCQSPQ